MNKRWHRVQHTPSKAYTQYSIHPVQHTPITAYIEYSIHRVQDTQSTAYTAYCIILRSTVSHSQPVSHLSADYLVLNSLHSHNYELTNQERPRFHCKCLPIYRLQMPRPPDALPLNVSPDTLHSGFQVHLWVPLISSSECISKLTQLWPPSASLSSVNLSVSMGISKLARFRPPSVSPNTLRSRSPSTSGRNDGGCMEIQG